MSKGMVLAVELEVDIWERMLNVDGLSDKTPYHKSVEA